MAHRIRRPSTARPTADLGFQVRTIRKSLGVTHEVLAAKAKMRAPQISLLETGHNVESRAAPRGFRPIFDD